MKDRSAGPMNDYQKDISSTLLELGWSKKAKYNRVLTTVHLNGRKQGAAPAQKKWGGKEIELLT